MTGSGGLDEAHRAEASEQAARWFAVLRGPSAGRERARFESWLEENEGNRAAYAQVVAIFSDADVLKTSDIYGEHRSPGVTRPARPWQPVALAAGLGLAMLVGLSWTSLRTPPVTAPPILAQTYATGDGAMRHVRLAAGANLTLDAATEVKVEEGPGRRVLTLAKGRIQIRLNVGSPTVVVRAGDSSITSANGILDVAWTDGQDTQVQLYEGRAEARPLLQHAAFLVDGDDIPLGRPVRVSGGGMQMLEPRFAVDERDWPAGWAQYRSVPVWELARSVNRYAATPIVIDDPDIRSLRISGRFRFVDAPAVARNVANVFGLTVTERRDGLHIERP